MDILLVQLLDIYTAADNKTPVAGYKVVADIEQLDMDWFEALDNSDLLAASKACKEPYLELDKAENGEL